MSITQFGRCFSLSPHVSHTTRIRVSYNDGTGYSEWTYNSSNQLVSGTTGLGGMAAPGTGISYDASGDLTAFGGMTLTYDATGRLAEVTGFAAGAFV